MGGRFALAHSSGGTALGVGKGIEAAGQVV